MKNKLLILCCLIVTLIVASGCEQKANSNDMARSSTTSESSLVGTSATTMETNTQSITDTTTATSSEILTQSSSETSKETTRPTKTSEGNKPKTTTDTSTENTVSTSAELSSTEATSSSTEATTSESTEKEVEFDLGIIYYEHLNINDPIQANAKYLGCYIVDDGGAVNFVPLKSDTVQNLYEYTSGQGNEEYYQQIVNIALETSNLTRGKPVSILDREGGVVIITAKDGKITYSE